MTRPPGAVAERPLETDLREVLSRFASGITVITGVADGAPIGLTCQSFSSLSLRPPMVLFCPARTSRSWKRIRPTRRFTVNVLEESQRRVSAVFAQRSDDKFAAVDWAPGPAGTPHLAGALAHIDAEVEHVVPGGDHQVVMGRVSGAALRATGRPLLYYRSGYETLAW